MKGCLKRGVDRPGLCLRLVGGAPSPLEAGGPPACGDLQSESLTASGPTLPTSWCFCRLGAAPGKVCCAEEEATSQSIQVKTELCRKQWDGVTGIRTHLQETQCSLPVTSCAFPTARLRFPGPSAPRTCTWAAPPPSGGCYLKPGADLRSGALECFISLLFIAGWVASEILFNFSGFRFPQLCDTQWPRRDISLLMKNGVFWMFSLYLEEYTGVGVELGSCSGRDPVTLGSQFIF